MYELIPILTGVAAGAITWRLSALRARLAAVATLGLAAAFIAGALSGELRESWLFLLWDLAQTVVVATLMRVARPRGARPSQPKHARQAPS